LEKSTSRNKRERELLVMTRKKNAPSNDSEKNS